MSPTTIWLIAMILLVIGEVLTVGLTFLWFAVGTLGGLLAAGDKRYRLSRRREREAAARPGVSREVTAS